MADKGNNIFIDEVFRLYYRPLCLYALHYTQNTDDAEDVVQDCVTDFLERSSDGLHVDDCRAYLYRMVRNRCLDLLKADSRIDRESCAEELGDMMAAEDYEEASFTEARLWTAIDSLPERCREALLLSKRDGLKYEEIAEELGISVNTVKNQISKALKVLKEGAHKVYTFFFG